jgi:hypothetical protein
MKPRSNRMLDGLLADLLWQVGGVIVLGRAFVQVFLADRHQRQQGRRDHGCRQQQHAALRQVGGPEAEQGRGGGVADRSVTGVDADLLGERIMPDQRQRQRRDSRHQRAAGHPVQDLGPQHRQPGGKQCQRQGADADQHQRGAGRQALAAGGVDQQSGGQLAEQCGDGADAQRDADIGLVPVTFGQVHRHERAEARLHRSQHQVQQAEGVAALVGLHGAMLNRAMPFRSNPV